MGGALCLLAVLFRASAPGLFWPSAAGACFLLFLALLSPHDRVIRAERQAAELARINEEALHRLARKWAELPLPALPADLQGGGAARDLHLFGPASLFHLLGTARTPPGKTTLACWLRDPAPPAEVARRQAAVAELAPELDFRQRLALAARSMEKAEPDPGDFLRWAEGEPWLLARPRLLWTTRALAALTLGLLPLAMAGRLPWSAWSLLPLANFVLGHLTGGRIAGIFDRVASREGELLHYAEVFRRLEGRAFAGDLLGRLAADLTAEGESAARQMDRLHRRVVLSDSRRSEPIHFVLQTLMLWDFQVLAAIERWQVRSGRHARRWLAALGEIEALAALAGLAHDQPGWAFPRLVENAPAPVYAARALGHPLLPEDVRITNDVTVGPPGTFLLVTGSNMSGKSTLLRAIGVNAVLAQAGAPVCADALELPPVTLGTSILIEDSLESGVSFFLAELQRIKAIVDAADDARAGGRTLLYLLDEVLRGTNTAERQIAIREVLLRLVASGAIGAVSTHDLELARLPELQPALRAVHFRESFEPDGEETKMTFDYRMRPGLATTVNALALLRMVGLGEGAADRSILE